MPYSRNTRFARLRPRSNLVRQAQIEFVLHQTRFQTIEATMLGLSITREFMNRQGVSLELSSKP